MTIRRQSGFTLLEIMMVIAILGILAGTAVPVYQTWQLRARGSEAKVMIKQILDAQITYYLDKNKFFPDNNTYIVYSDGRTDPSGPDVLDSIKRDLNVDIATGHHLDFTLKGVNIEGIESFQLDINSDNPNLDLFAGGAGISATLDKTGQITYNYF